MRNVLRSVQRRLPRARQGALVLAYHLVEAKTGGVVDLPLDTFRAHLELLSRARDIKGLHDVDPLLSGQVVLTFDDAYQNFYDVVWPELRDRGLPALLYVPVDYIDGGPAPIRGTTLPPCSWDQLREMAEEGLELGSHTCSHPDLAKVSAHQLEHEIAGARDLIERRTGASARSFCYPRALFSTAADRWVRKVHDTATVGGGGRLGPDTDPHRIPRVSLRNDHSLRDLHTMLDQRVWLEEALADRVRQLRR